MQHSKTKNFTTISDVAKYAKVGKTSVSRYLNGEQEKMSQALRERIAHAITALDYRPNHSARMLRAGQSKLIGLLLADVTNPYSIEVLQGIEQVCRRQGYMLMVCNTDHEASLQDQYLSLLDAHRVDGIIINTASISHAQADSFNKVACPMVLIDRVNTTLEVDSVGLNNRDAAQQGITHLQGQNYQAILVVSEALTIAPRQQRSEALADFAKANPQLSYQLCEIDKQDESQLTTRIEHFIAAHPEQKCAIFTTNGVATMWVAKALKKLALRVGQDIGLSGIDDPEWAELFEGGITVMRQPTRRIGETACERLIDRIQGDQQAPQHIELSAELIVRHST